MEKAVGSNRARLAILDYTAETGADLIVVGHQGFYGVLGMLGSTSHALVNLAKCDVLVVRCGN